VKYISTILNRLGITHEWNRQTGGQASRYKLKLPLFATLRGQKNFAVRFS